MLWKLSKLLFSFEAFDPDRPARFPKFFSWSIFPLTFYPLIFFIYILHSFVLTTSKCACTCRFSSLGKQLSVFFFTGLLTTRGSVSDKPLSTWEHLSEKGDLTRRTAEEQSFTEEEITPQEGGTTGDQHTASSAAIALQGDVKWETSVVMEKTSEPGAVAV